MTYGQRSNGLESNRAYDVRRRRVKAGVLCILLCWSEVASAAPAAVRLVDQIPGNFGNIITGTSKRILGRKVNEIAVPLPAAIPSDPVLTFAAGVRPLDSGGTVRFEVWLRPRSGAEVQLYRRDLSEPGWYDERVDLRPHVLDGAQLLFRRSLLAGTMPRAIATAWGDPIIVTAQGAPAPSVILISLDTLRFDRLGVGGHQSARTPNLDALARAGILYEHAYSSSTWTFPSHQSLFFGLYPGVDPYPQVPKGMPTPDTRHMKPLAEIFRDAGYLTAGFTGGGYVSHNFGFARGFDTYYMYMFNQRPPTAGHCDPKRFDGEEVFTRTTRWLRDHGRAPFFLFVHTYEPHDRCPFLRGKDVFEWGFEGADGRREVLDYYDGLIAKTDELMGTLLREVDRLGLASTTLIAVTSDHGEGFAEHGIIGHGDSTKPYEEIARVPLILRYPGVLQANQRIATPVSAIDLAPSILALLKVPTTARTDGSVLPGVDAAAAGTPKPLFVQSDDILAVRNGRYKLITARTGTFPDEVYDLQEDPAETRNLATSDTAVTTELKGHAATYWERASPGSSKPVLDHLDTETKERLRALGYQ